MDEKQYLLDNFGKVMRSIRVDIYFSSVKPPEYEHVETLLKEKYPQIEGEMVDEIFGKMAVDYQNLRELQRFGKTRGEIIGKVGDVIMSDESLSRMYWSMLRKLAREYDPSEHETIGEKLRIIIPKRQYTLEDKIQIMNGKLLRLGFPDRSRKA